jgi:hypothetical protein
MKSLIAVLLLLVGTAFSQKVTWQKINFPDGNGPVAMNDLGDILNNTCYIRSHVNGSFTQINNPYPQDSLSCNGINNAGTVVGTEAATDNTYFGVALPNYGEGSPQKIIYPGSSQTYAMGINDYGTIVGSYNYSFNGQPTTGGFWLYHGQRPYHALNSGGFALGISGLTGVNDSGTFIGTCVEDVYYQPCNMLTITANGPAVSYNTPGYNVAGDPQTLVITGVNIHGSVVGWTNESEGIGPYGILVENGVPQVLTAPDGSPTELTAIDKWGNIAGIYQDGGFVRWVKCTPKVGCN